MSANLMAMARSVGDCTTLITTLQQLWKGDTHWVDVLVCIRGLLGQASAQAVVAEGRVASFSCSADVAVLRGS